MNRVFVTGAAGFVGSNVLRRLMTEGREVAVLLRSSSDRRRIDHMLGRCTVIAGDLTDVEAMRPALSRFAPDGAIHLAWEGVKGADRNSDVQLRNIHASFELYRLAQDVGCRHFVGLGSQAEYGPLAGRISEDAPKNPTTVYGAAKLATGIVLERSAATAGRSFAWMRLFSSYGPDDDPSWLIPYMVGRLLAGEKPSLTRAEQVWDYLHVDDVAAGIIAALDSASCGVFNLGSGQARPLHEIITMIRDRIDPSLPLGFGEVPYRPDQVMHLEADISRLSAASGWVPRVSLEAGIAATVDWYRNKGSHVR